MIGPLVTAHDRSLFHEQYDLGDGFVLAREMHPRLAGDGLTRQYVYVDTNEDRHAGHIVLDDNDGAWSIRFHQLYDGARGRGLGRKAMAILRRELGSLSSDPQGVTSDAAVKAWQSLGARQVPTRKNSKGLKWALESRWDDGGRLLIDDGDRALFRESYDLGDGYTLVRYDKEDLWYPPGVETRVYWYTHGDEKVGELRLRANFDGMWAVTEHRIFDRARGRALGQRAVAKLRGELGPMSSNPQGSPSPHAVKMWQRLGAKEVPSGVSDGPGKKWALEAISLKGELEHLRPDMAAAAQTVYDEWEQDKDGCDAELGTGGICDRISAEISGVIAGAVAADTLEGGQEGDDHSFLIVYRGDEAYGVDIAPGRYERGSGYTWKKKPGVTFGADDIEIFEVPLPEGGVYEAAVALAGRLLR